MRKLFRWMIFIGFTVWIIAFCSSFLLTFLGTSFISEIARRILIFLAWGTAGFVAFIVIITAIIINSIWKKRMSEKCPKNQN